MMQKFSRRQFSLRLFKVLMYGGFTHFTISNMSKGAVLSHSSISNEGKTQELCLSDILKGEETDICPGGNNTDDVCSPTQGYTDFCPGEKMPEDECPPNGNREEDKCSTGLQEFDICVSGYLIGGKSPDQCPAQNANTDDCKPSEDDQYDVCWSGKEQDDLCESKGGNNGIYDECPGGEDGLDRCESTISDDYCVSGMQKSDACPNGIPPEDSCAGGLQPDDICYIHTLNSDECDPINSGSDQNGCKTAVLDECYAVDVCVLSPMNDIAE